MNKGRCLGLLGGLGVGATIHYYRNLVRGHEEQGRTLDIVITHSETSRVFEYVQAVDPDGLAEYLLGFTRRLKDVGAEFAVIPAITPHYCIRELAAVSPLPLFNIFDPLVEELAARGIRRVAVFGTRYVMESSLFGLAGDVEIIRLRPEETECVHGTYLELLEKGVGTEEQHGRLTAIADAVQRRDGVEAILLAGTDLSLLFHEANTEFPHVDCAALHIRRILKGILGGVAVDSGPGGIEAYH